MTHLLIGFILACIFTFLAAQRIDAIERFFDDLAWVIIGVCAFGTLFIWPLYILVTPIVICALVGLKFRKK